MAGSAFAICASDRLFAGDVVFFDSFESTSNCAWSSATQDVAPAVGLGMSVATIPAPPGSMNGSCSGSGGERVFAYTPAVPGTLRFALSDTQDTGIYIRDGCAGGAELICVDAGTAGQGELGTLALADTETVFLVIDSANGPGDITLNLALCGDGVIEAGEICDGNDHGGMSCVSLGFSGGNLVCFADCQGFDVTGCF